MLKMLDIMLARASSSWPLLQKQPIHKHCVKTGVTECCVRTLKLLNSQEQSFRAFTRMADVCVQSKQSRANSVVCSFCDATVAGCS